MVWQLKNKPQNEHASNVGAMIARSISLQLGIPAYIYDGVTVDELLPINKLTGLPSMRRKGMGHNLNTRRRGPALCPGERQGLQGHHRHRGPPGRRHLRQPAPQRED